MECCGTAGLKYMMNGALTLATCSGVNMEISGKLEEPDKEMFMFGTPESHVEDVRDDITNKKITISDNLKNVLNSIKTNQFGEYPCLKQEIINIFNGNDYYLLTSDFDEYTKLQK